MFVREIEEQRMENWRRLFDREAKLKGLSEESNDLLHDWLDSIPDEYLDVMLVTVSAGLALLQD